MHNDAGKGEAAQSDAGARFEACSLERLKRAYSHLITRRCPLCDEYSLCVNPDYPRQPRLRCYVCDVRLPW
jgi:hypothetical protein